jgi:hypothetical protein
MKHLKLVFLSLFLMATACTQAADFKFITNATVSIPASLDGLKYMNPDNVLSVAQDPTTRTIAITYIDGTIEQWVFASSADFYFVLDKIFGDPRFYVTGVYGTNNHSAYPKTAIKSATCTQPDPGVQFYIANFLLRNGTAVMSNGYSINVCQTFNGG